MSLIDQLLIVAAEYGRAEGVDDVTVSWRIFGDSKKLAALKAGKDIQVKRMEAAMRTLSAKWPDAASWPDEVARPQITQDAAA